MHWSTARDKTFTNWFICVAETDIHDRNSRRAFVPTNGRLARMWSTFWASNSFVRIISSFFFWCLSSNSLKCDLFHRKRDSGPRCTFYTPTSCLDVFFILLFLIIRFIFNLLHLFVAFRVQTVLFIILFCFIFIICVYNMILGRVRVSHNNISFFIILCLRQFHLIGVIGVNEINCEPHGITRRYYDWARTCYPVNTEVINCIDSATDLV